MLQEDTHQESGQSQESMHRSEQSKMKATQDEVDLEHEEQQSNVVPTSHLLFGTPFFHH